MWSRAQGTSGLRPAPTKPSDSEGLLVVGCSDAMAGCVQVCGLGGGLVLARWLAALRY